MQILYNNKAVGSTITYSSQVYLYDAENVVTIDTKETWRTENALANYIVFDLGSAMSIDSIGIKNHNLNNGDTIKIQGHTSDAWTSPDISVDITWRDCNTLFQEFIGGSKRYWRFYVDSTGNSDGYIEIGTIYIGSILDMPNMSPTITFEPNNNSFVEYSTSNQSYGDLRSFWMQYVVEFPDITNAQRKSITTMLETIQNVTPFFIHLFDDDQDFEDPFYATITNANLPFKKDRFVLFQASLNFRETD